MTDTIRVPSQKPVRKIAVLLSNQRYSDHPRAFVEDKILDEWIACGWAKRIGRNKIQLTKPAEMKLRDTSASFGAGAMRSFAAGSKHHKALFQAAWA